MPIHCWIIAALILMLVLYSNRRELMALLFGASRRRSKHLRETITTPYFSVVKPAGFYVHNAAPPQTLYLDKVNFYSETSAGAISIVDGRQIHEKFNHAWARASVSEKFSLAATLNAVKSRERTILNETETVSPDGEQTTFVLTTTERSPGGLYEIEARFKIVEDRRTNRIYELSVCVLTAEKAKYADAANEIIESFEILPA